jgi:hypothetical protein
MRQARGIQYFRTVSMRVSTLLVLAFGIAALGAGCGADSEPTGEASTTAPATTAEHELARTITVLGSRHNSGPFEDSLSLKLVDGTEPIPFYVCAAWGKEQAPAGCVAARGTRLPAGTTLRLEQHPPGPAVRYPDSPGWGTVGTSETPELSAPLSNGVTGNRFGKVTFRATLRDRASGRLLATSNTFTLTWHK